MEREGRREGEGRGRRREGGGEMRKGILIGGMVLSLLLGCNNGGEDPQKVFLKSVVSLGNNFLDVFTSFGEMAGSALGFKKDPQKSDVANYFKNIQKTVEGTRDKLKTMVENMRKEGNPNAEATDGAVKKLINEKLEIIIQGAKKASGAIGTVDEPLGDVAAAKSNAGGSPGTKVDELVGGIKDIVKVVLGKDEGSAEAGNANKAEDTPNKRNVNGSDGAGKLFDGTGKADIESDAKKAANDAAKAVGAVSGADILQAIVKDNSDSIKFAQNTAASVANVNTAPQDAIIAGGVALRAMTKGGKFANGSTDVSALVKGAAVSAVNKALDTLTIAIRKTIDAGLKEVKEAMKINANDNPVTSETGANK